MTDTQALRETLERRGICIYRDGRHYIPVFTRGGGSAEDEARAIFAALRLAEVVPEVEKALKVVKRHGQLLFEMTGDADFDAAQNEVRDAVADALLKLQSAKAPT